MLEMQIMFLLIHLSILGPKTTHLEHSIATSHIIITPCHSKITYIMYGFCSGNPKMSKMHIML